MDKNKEKEKDEIEALLKEPKRRISPGFLVALILLIGILVMGVLRFISLNRGSFSQAEFLRSAQIGSGGAARISAFAGGFLRYSQDGISLLDGEGKERWNISCNMNRPQLVTQGSWGAMADLTGRKVVVFNQGGLSGSYTTTYDIMNLSVSAGGVTALVLDNGLNSLIQFYDKGGSRLDIEMSFEMSMSGYPLALALSPDGNGLAVAFASSSGGGLDSQLAFYNFSVGKSEPDRLMGYFKYEGSLMPQVDYLGAHRVAAVTDERLDFFSLEQENKPTILSTVILPPEVYYYRTGQEKVVLIGQDPATGHQTLQLYNSNGSLLFAKELDGAFISLSLEERGLLLLTDQGLSLISYNGTLRFSGSLRYNGHPIFMQGLWDIIQFDGSHIYHYRLK